MEFDDEPSTIAELATIDLAIKEFTKRIRTLVAKADAVFANDDTERKSAS